MAGTTKKTPTKKTATKRASAKSNGKKAPASRNGRIRLKPGESFEEFHARVWNLVHDSYARAREAEEAGTQDR